MSFKFRPAERIQTSLLIGIAGASGSGKTASALKLARGILGGQDEGIFLIDTEANRSTHYACAPGEKTGPFAFRFQHCEMRPPFSSDTYREVIGAAVDAGAKVIIVDGMSAEHEGAGGMLEAQAAELARMGGQESKKFAAWIKPKSDHGRLVNFILQQRCHFIFTFRAKDKMKLVKVEKNGRSTIEPVQLGWTAICSDRFEYELTTMLMLPPTARGVPDFSLESTKINAHHEAFFPVGQPIDEDAGRKLAAWARGGASITTAAAVGGVSMDGSAPPPVKGAPVLTTEQKVSWARDALRLPDEQFDKIALHKLKGPLADAPDEEIESKLVPFLRACIKKNQVALDELAKIIAEVPA